MDFKKSIVYCSKGQIIGIIYRKLYSSKADSNGIVGLEKYLADVDKFQGPSTPPML